MPAVLNQIKLFSCTKSRYLSEKIAEAYGKPLGDLTFTQFSDGEFQSSFNESVRGCDIFIIQSTFPSADNLMEMLMAIDAAKRASAHYITAVIPYFGLARQDRKDKPRVSIASKMVADVLTAVGASRVMTMDLHAPQIQGFFNIPVDHLDATSIFLPYIKDLKLPNLTIAAPDMGGTSRARYYAKALNADMVICDKYRKRANEVAEMTLIGNVEGKDVVLIDDMIDTGGTLCNAAKIIMEKGAKSVRALCTHAVLSGKAYENIEQSVLSELIVTNSLPLKQESKKIKSLSVAKLFAQAIRNAHEHKSINSLFITPSV